MGMDYSYAGSASYPRFNEELCAVAEIFGGVKVGAVFDFPIGTNETLVKWFNNIYGDFTCEETKAVWELVSEHPEIKEISHQIWRELEAVVEFGEAWYIY